MQTEEPGILNDGDNIVSIPTSVPAYHAYGKKLLWGILILGSIGGLAVLFGPDPLQVDMGIAEHGPMSVTVTAEGRTQVFDNYEISAPIAGELGRINLQPGDHVTANKTLLAVIYPSQPQFHDERSQAELQAKVAAAQAQYDKTVTEVDRAEEQYKFAITKMKRYKQLDAKGVISRQEMDQIEMEAKIQKSALKAARKAIKQHEAELNAVKASLIDPSNTTIVKSKRKTVKVYSPVSGRVFKILKESETQVTPGMPLIVLGDATKIEIVLEMLSEDAVKVQEGAEAVLHSWGGKTINAKVKLIEPFGYTKVSALGIEEQRVHVLLSFTDPPEIWNKLGDGYRVNAKIVVWKNDNVLKLPMGALFRDGAEWATFVVDDSGVAQLKHIQVGHINDIEAEILDGIDKDAKVILHPSDLVANGVPVRSRDKK